MHTQDTDQLLTAYATHELPADDRADVEARLAAEPALRARLDEIEATIGLVTQALQSERVVSMPPARPSPRAWWILSSAAAAACVAIGVGLMIRSAQRPVPPVTLRLPATAPDRSVVTAVQNTTAPTTQPPSLAHRYAADPAHWPKLSAARVTEAEARFDAEVFFAQNENSGRVGGAAPAAGPDSLGRSERNTPALGLLAGDASKSKDARTVVEKREAGGFQFRAPPGAAPRDSLNYRDAAAPGGPSRAWEETTAFRPAGDTARGGHNTEAYARIVDNAFLDAVGNPLSTFSIDVDTAAYSNFRRFINQGQLPPPDAVRIEEMVNYFPYDYAPPTDGKPFAASMEVAAAPWAPQHRLVRVGIKGRVIATDKRPPSNLVFLLDVSGSMNEPNKLPLVKQALTKLVGGLNENDRVAIAVYAGSSGLVLPSTRASDKATISRAIDALQPGGSTNGAAGIALAYQQAESGFIKDGTNRVILCTDGDFNVGITDEGQLTRLIEEKAKGGTFLSVLGFGMGNLKDATMEKLADKGNGNYGYIDTAREADKLLVEQMSGTLVTIAKDVKIQVEFNPAKVGSYRLIGYENRMLAKEDFNNDLKDAGEIGAGHTVTALYEIVPAGAAELKTRTTAEIDEQIAKINDLLTRGRFTPEGLKALQDQLATLEKEKAAAVPDVDKLKYQQPATTAAVTGDDLMTLKIRYKAPEAPLEQGTSKLLEFPLRDDPKAADKLSPDFSFAAGVAGVGMVLRDSPHKGTATYDSMLALIEKGTGPDAGGYRAEFVELVRKAKQIAGKEIELNK